MAAIGLQAVLEATFLGFNMNFHLEDKGGCLVCGWMGGGGAFLLL